MRKFYAACLLFIAVIALMCAFLRACAQDTVHVASKGRWVRYGLFAVSVTSSALGDGLNSRTKYAAGHTLSALSYASLIAIPFVSHKATWKQPATYLLIRYALFDALYNVGAKRNLNYIGGKNYYDESVGKVPLPVLHATKFAALALSVVINLK